MVERLNGMSKSLAAAAPAGPAGGLLGQGGAVDVVEGRLGRTALCDAPEVADVGGALQPVRPIRQVGALEGQQRSQLGPARDLAGEAGAVHVSGLLWSGSSEMRQTALTATAPASTRPPARSMIHTSAAGVSPATIAPLTSRAIAIPLQRSAAGNSCARKAPWEPEVRAMTSP